VEFQNGVKVRLQEFEEGQTIHVVAVSVEQAEAANMVWILSDRPR
jgi:hypothetical protein